MPSRETTPALSWIATQRWRAGLLGRDLARLALGAARALRHAATPAPPAPGLALLAGEPIARRGTANLYRIRVHNPSTRPRTLRLLASGAGGEPFVLACDVELAPQAREERWLESTWTGGGRFVDAPRGGEPVWSASGECVGRWTLEARLLEDGRERDRLVIGGEIRA